MTGLSESSQTVKSFIAASLLKSRFGQMEYLALEHGS
jgi:hypothetical protein